MSPAFVQLARDLEARVAAYRVAFDRALARFEADVRPPAESYWTAYNRPVGVVYASNQAETASGVDTALDRIRAARPATGADRDWQQRALTGTTRSLAAEAFPTA